MHRESRLHTEWRAAFGPFTLSPSERLLERDGVPVRLGGRALDILVVLVESAGETIGKKELIARVWPGMVVEEGSLRFHMVAVRKALGDVGGGTRYIVNTANKGYTFIGRVERQELAAQIRPASPNIVKPLPALATAILGRDEEVRALVGNLLQRRFVSVVGAGGIGKTTVAIAATQMAAMHFDGDVHFVDLSATSGAGLIRATVASAVGLQNRLDDLSALEAHLSDRKSLIILDCCEHVIGEAAELAEVVVRGCPQVHVLATSREPLLAHGEFVYRLQPLRFPPDGEGTTAASALAYPAVKLFVERAAANGSGFELKDSDAPLASQLCRELEGIALAIELAAGRIEALGLKAITSHFDASIRLMWHGRRTAVPRHQTLNATLDWSFNLLNDDEKQLLRRLSVFAGTFSLDAAIAVCCSDCDRTVGIELIASLVSKSLVTVDAGGPALRYSMLDTTKSYSRKKLSDLEEEADVCQRFAMYFDAWAQQWLTQNLEREALNVMRTELPNLRAALELHFRDGGRTAGAVRLAAALCPLLLQLSQVNECARWARAALLQLPPSLLGSHVEVQLQGALGQSLIYSTGNRGGDAARAFTRALEVAEHLGDVRSTLHLLNGYVVLLHREGKYTDALATARKAESLLPGLDDPELQATVNSLLGMALQLVGKLNEAHRHWEDCISYGAGASSFSTSTLGFDFHILALCGLARGLWLTGHYSKARAIAGETMEKARDSGHAVTYCIALIWAGSVFVWGRDVNRLHDIVEEVERVAKCHSLIPYLNVVSITRGQILIARGRVNEGIERIKSAVEVLHDCRYELVTSLSLVIVARGLSAMSLHAAALGMCDEVEQLIRTEGDFLRMPELFAARGHCLAAAGRPDEAEKSYLEAIGLARSQGAKSGEVRAAVSLAQHLIGVDRTEDAHRILQPYLIDAGDEVSQDLVLARSLLV
ncbi:ATP-binding protein [Collimonas arenae]|nr:winged helix-turn-helix domain-containing protein [Collimonas arenae]